MAKKIILYSKLIRDRRERVNKLLDAKKINAIEVNGKKGVLMTWEEDDFFVILDTWSGFGNEQDDDEEDEDDEDEEFDGDFEDIEGIED